MDPYIRTMFGENAVHCGFNMIVQDAGEGKVITVGQASNGNDLRFGSKRTHVLLMGDLVFRPHLVCATDSFRGHGLTGLLKEGFNTPEKWIDDGDIVLDAYRRLSELKKRT